MHRVLQPQGWPRPRGFANGMSASGRMVFVAGQIGWDAQGRFPSTTLAGQTRQALVNNRDVLAEDGARPEHIVRMTWYVTSRQEYHEQQQELGRVYREILGCHYPAMSVVQVVALIESAAKVEIEVTAVVPAD